MSGVEAILEVDRRRWVLPLDIHGIEGRLSCLPMSQLANLVSGGTFGAPENAGHRQVRSINITKIFWRFVYFAHLGLVPHVDTAVKQ